MRVSRLQLEQRQGSVAALLAADYTYTDIARELGITKGAVSKIVTRIRAAADTSVSPMRVHDFYARIAELQSLDHGPQQIYSILCDEYPGSSDIPSETTIARFITKNNLARPSFNSKHRYYPKLKVDAPRQVFQVDTVKFLGTEYLSCIDIFSRAACVICLDGTNAAAALMSCFQSLGVPHTLQMDNGVGFAPAQSGHLSHLMNYAFASGVDTIRFIPVAHPEKNGHIERFHRTLRRLWVSAGMPDDVFSWMPHALHLYNHVLNHSGLGKKGSRRRPVDAHGQILTAPQPHAPLTFSRKLSDCAGKTLEFVRLVSMQCIATNPAPSFVWALPTRDTCGNYLVFRCEIGGPCLVLGRSLLADGFDVIGTAEHPWSGNTPRRDAAYMVQLAPGVKFKPRNFDEKEYARVVARHTKRAARPTTAPEWCEIIDQSDGGWYVVDTRTGEVLYSSECGDRLDHATELFG